MKKYLPILAALLILLTACSQHSVATWQEQYDLGARYLSEGNYEAAIIAFTAAIEIDPKKAPAFVGRGDAYFAEDDYSSAESDYRTAKGLDSSLVDVYDRLADLYVQTGNLEQALQILREGYEATGSQGMLNRLQALENLDELPELPADLPDAAIVVSMYSAEYGFEGHDAYQFDGQGRMTSNTWYGQDNIPIVQETWVYNDESGTATNTRGEIDDNGQWIETTETEDGTENRGWYWYSMGSDEDEYITDPTLETESGRINLESGGWADYGYDTQGRAITIHTYSESGQLIGYCVVTYTH